MRTGMIVALGACLGLAGIAQAQEPPLGAGVVVMEGAADAPSVITEDEGGGFSYRVWGSLDYLAWWFKDANTPALLTSGPTSSAGILGRPGTQVLFGGHGVDLQEHSGMRFMLGAWLCEDQGVGIEGGYFFLGNRSTSRGVNNPPGVVTARPFFNVGNNAEDSQLVSVPGALNGRAFAALDSRLEGAEINLVLNPSGNNCGPRIEAIAGFRYLMLRDGLIVEEDLQVAPTVGGIGGSHFFVQDSFTAENRFYGGQIGLRCETPLDRWTFGASGKVAMGCVDQTVNVYGLTSITPPGQPAVAKAGGLLALTSNIGTYHRNSFAFVPEIGLNVGYRITDNIRLRAGYSFLYWSDVARSGDQVDRAVNPALIPASGGAAGGVGPARPQFHFRDTDFFAHGINLGMEIRY